MSKTPLFNIKYKTELCKQFMMGKSCPLAHTCIYAHGKSELRTPNDVITTYQPININQHILNDPKLFTSVISQPMGSDRTAQSINKISLQYEDFFKQYQEIVNSLNKPQQSDLAKPFIEKPTFDFSHDPSVQKRVIVSQLKLITRQMLKLKQHPIIISKLKVALQLLQVQNIQSCSDIINDIIYRKTSPKEDSDKYQEIIVRAQELAKQLFAEEKMKYKYLQSQQQSIIKKHMRKQELQKKMKQLQLKMFGHQIITR